MFLYPSFFVVVYVLRNVWLFYDGNQLFTSPVLLLVAISYLCCKYSFPFCVYFSNDSCTVPFCCCSCI